MWSSYDCYLTGMRDVIGLNLPVHEKYIAWEKCAKLSGFRYVHEEFCMVSERPIKLSVDAQNRPHSNGSPSHIWRDGFFINFWHGVRLPNDIWSTQLTIEKISSEKNAEVKRTMMEIYGMDKYLDDCGANPIDQTIDQHGNPVELFMLPNSQLPIVRVVNSSPEPDGSFKNYVLTATKKVNRAVDALASLAGTTADKYIPVLES